MYVHSFGSLRLSGLPALHRVPQYAWLINAALKLANF